MSKKYVVLEIPAPCSQEWDSMTPNSTGRHCTHCKKTVIDFTTWDDAALFHFFSRDNGNVCGRFFDTQLNRHVNIPYQPHSRLYRMTMALGLTLICAQTPQLLAQNRPPKIEHTPFNRVSDTGYGDVSGTVIDEKKQPMVSVAIMVYQNGILKGGDVTDIDGKYTVKPLTAGNYDVLMVYPGYDSVMISSVLVVDSETTVQNAYMTIHTNVGSPIQPIFLGRIISTTDLDMDNPTRRVYRRDEINRMPR